MGREPRDHDGVKHRAPIALRGVVALLALGAVLSNVALLLSDRAPGLLRLLFGDFARRLSKRLDTGGRAGDALGARNVGNDSLVHFGLWAVATILIGIAVWSWIGLATSALAISASSLVIEIAQGRYSDTRSVEAKDAFFNLMGIASGTVAVAVLYLGYSAVASYVAANNSDSTP